VYEADRVFAVRARPEWTTLQIVSPKASVTSVPRCIIARDCIARKKSNFAIDSIALLLNVDNPVPGFPNLALPTRVVAMPHGSAPDQSHPGEMQ